MVSYTWPPDPAVSPQLAVDWWITTKTCREFDESSCNDW